MARMASRNYEANINCTTNEVVTYAACAAAICDIAILGISIRMLTLLPYPLIGFETTETRLHILFISLCLTVATTILPALCALVHFVVVISYPRPKDTDSKQPPPLPLVLLYTVVLMLLIGAAFTAGMCAVEFSENDRDWRSLKKLGSALIGISPTLGVGLLIFISWCCIRRHAAAESEREKERLQGRLGYHAYGTH
eukprot:TRINITY_DN60716_c0_g1_i1.p1 TRINITY_DN60716_c0_g1~~TRINITY_DN60716_c0_g1_i1.p1  ORF type:complete len:197 (+),score=11.35 TRINITY_DN60716_c0_g1_i1:44-634(+)